MTKYRQYFEKMISDHREFFDAFRSLHDRYALEPQKCQEEYNIEGEKALEIIREYENRLCANTERGMYNKFSSILAEKFQNEVRNHFNLIDHVGLKIEKNSFEQEDNFVLKKINLN